MERNKFLQAAPNGIQSWAVLIKDSRTDEHTLRDPRSGLVSLLVLCGGQLGINIAPVKQIIRHTHPSEQNERSIENELRTLSKNNGGLQIVIVILPGSGPGSKEAYGRLIRDTSTTLQRVY